jgi:hypothetical protein
LNVGAAVANINAGLTLIFNNAPEDNKAAANSTTSDILYEK